MFYQHFVRLFIASWLLFLTVEVLNSNHKDSVFFTCFYETIEDFREPENEKEKDNLQTLISGFIYQNKSLKTCFLLPVSSDNTPDSPFLQIILPPPESCNSGNIL
jgi:hypothetical protein